MPDICTTAKALGAGFPIGAVMASDKASKYFVPGDHGCTFGGNPLACAVGNTVMKQLFEKGILENVREMSAYLFEKLNGLKQQYKVIEDIRGMGLLIGVQLADGMKTELIAEAMKNKLLLAGAGHETVRFLPPLNVTKDEIDIAMEKFEMSLKML